MLVIELQSETCSGLLVKKTNKGKALKFKEQDWIDDAIDRGLKLKDTLKNSINAARKKK